MEKDRCSKTCETVQSSKSKLKKIELQDSRTHIRCVTWQVLRSCLAFGSWAEITSTTPQSGGKISHPGFPCSDRQRTSEHGVVERRNRNCKVWTLWQSSRIRPVPKFELSRWNCWCYHRLKNPCRRSPKWRSQLRLDWDSLALPETFDTNLNPALTYQTSTSLQTKTNIDYIPIVTEGKNKQWQWTWKTFIYIYKYKYESKIINNWWPKHQVVSLSVS